MTRYTRSKEKRTDPRPAYIPLGVDTEGVSHVYPTRIESAYTIEGATVAYHQPLEGHYVYMDYVADRRGWANRRLYHTVDDGLEQAIHPQRRSEMACTHAPTDIPAQRAIPTTAPTHNRGDLR